MGGGGGGGVFLKKKKKKMIIFFLKKNNFRIDFYRPKDLKGFLCFIKELILLNK